MAAVKTLVQALVDALQNLRTDVTGPVVSHVPIETFNETADLRLENYFLLKGITNEAEDADTKKVQLLIGCIGPKCSKVLHDLCTPVDPNTKSYTELKKLLTDHYDKPPNEIMERHCFATRTQNNAESITNFVAEKKYFYVLPFRLYQV